MLHKQKEWPGRKKVYGLITLLAIAFSCSTVKAQTLYVKQSNGTKTDVTLGSIRKLTFDTGNLTVTKTDNSTEVFELSGLQYLSLNDYSNNVLPVKNETLNMQVYPNPVRDELNIEFSNKGMVQILNLNGKVLLSSHVYSAGIISLPTGQLPKGLYLCRYSNEKEIKTVKILKQ